MQRKVDIFWAYNLYMEEIKRDLRPATERATIIAAAFTRAEMMEWY